MSTPNNPRPVHPLLANPETVHLYHQQNERLMQMTFKDRLLEFLSDCNRRGSRYSPQRNSLPNLSRLAMMCGCACSTLQRIADGDTKKPSLAIINTLNVIACICPPAFTKDILKERDARIRDANRWLDTPDSRKGKGPLLPVLMSGIARRYDALRLKQQTSKRA